MQYTVPHYYCKFKCIAGECPDTCCAGWQIAIDKKSLKKYKRIKGAAGNRLHNEINWREGIFRQYEGRCAFLNEENLCDLYLEGGRSLFCKTCRTYPRHIEEFEGLKEISLSLSCPVAAKMILNCKEPIRFLSREAHNVREERYEEFDYLLFTKLEDTRDVIFHTLQNRSIKIETRIAMVLALAHDLQQRIDKNALFEADSLLTRYQQENALEWFQTRMNEYVSRKERFIKRKQILKRMFDIFDGLEVLQEDWNAYLKNVKRTLFERQDVSYETSSDKRENIYKNEENEDAIDEEMQLKLPEQFDIAWEQLMVYFVYTYFCGAVYDENAYGKMKFALAGTVLIREIARALWIQRKRSTKEEVLWRDLEEAARKYAKEIEHSDSNKKVVEERLDKFRLLDLFQVL